MEVIRFFCVILACSLLLAQTTVAQDVDPNNSTLTPEPTTITATTTETQTTTATPLTSETTHSSSVSTESPTTTSEAKTTATTPATTPTEPPTTTVPSTTPAPPDNTWELHDDDENKTVCLKISMEITFKSTNDSENPFKLPSNATVGKGSTCGMNSSQVLILTYMDKSVNLTFDKDTSDKESIKFYLSYLTFTNGSATHTLNGSSESYMVGHLKKSFKCVTEKTSDLSDFESVTWKNVQIQAFMSQDDKGDFGAAEVCDDDSSTSDVVPIAVGCALAGLVVVVLIAYLVGRRRSRQKGYQSV